MRICRAIPIIVILLSLAGCIRIFGEPQHEEVARAKSPDGVVDAVLVRTNGGATTAFVFSVFVVPSGTVFDHKAALFQSERSLFAADHQEGLQLSWRAPKFLEVRFGKARIFRFTNFWHTQEVQNFTYIVELRLVPTDESSLLDRDKASPSDAADREQACDLRSGCLPSNGFSASQPHWARGS